MKPLNIIHGNRQWIMMKHRSAGILLHPSSLPSRYGYGDLGDWAKHFVSFLEKAGCQLWQILPIVPPGAGESPYSSTSAFAINPLLISLDRLVETGDLDPEDLRQVPDFPLDRIDFDLVKSFKRPLIQKAIARMIQRDVPQSIEFNTFLKEQSFWLEDFALFEVLCTKFENQPWWTWPQAYAQRNPDVLSAFKASHHQEILNHQLVQYLIETQWQSLKSLANHKGIKMIGDLPIYVDGHSADLWANQSYFCLDSQGKAEFVAGVPPDAFSEIGQFWGNPLYRWDVLKADGYRWWYERLKRALSQCDVVRIDHFRAFSAYWQIPAGAKTAMEGHWVDGPGVDFFEKIAQKMNCKTQDLPIIAEDLGVIDQKVIDLLETLGLSGMKILQFAFGEGNEQPYLPHMHTQNAVVYTGTHDNDTILGWWRSSDESVRDHVRRYLGISGDQISWDLIRSALKSVCHWAIVPLQDLLCLGNDARMNLPNTANGNWSWRVRGEALNDGVADRFRELTTLYARSQTKREKKD
jgi:4-alpha-glucanotransferase